MWTSKRPAAAHGSRLALFLLVLIPPVIGPDTARAAAAERDEAERWVPSASLFLGAVNQNASGSVESGDVLGPALGTPDQPIRPAASGSDSLLAGVFGGSLELMTPGLVEVFGRPRAFAHVDFLATFGFNRTLAGEGSPGPFMVQEGATGNLVEARIRGQGSRTMAEVDTFVLGAGAGPAFSFDVAGRRVRIKPSVEYMREELTVNGIVHRAVREQRPTRELDDFRLISLTGSQTEVYHGVGPGLELEVDTRRTGPFLLAVFASGAAYSFFGDREIELSDVNEFGETAEWTFEKDQWGWGVRFGLRFRWLPD